MITDGSHPSHMDPDPAQTPSSTALQSTTQQPWGLPRGPLPTRQVVPVGRPHPARQLVPQPRSLRAVRPHRCDLDVPQVAVRSGGRRSTAVSHWAAELCETAWYKSTNPRSKDCGRRCSGAIRCDLASWFSQCLADDPANIAGNPDCSFRPRVYYALCGSTASRECL